MWLAKVYVTLKPVVNDPQGLTIAGALRSLGFEGVAGVRAGKYIQVKLAEMPREDAEAQVQEMCRKLLANPVIEEFSFELEQMD